MSKYLRMKKIFFLITLVLFAFVFVVAKKHVTEKNEVKELVKKKHQPVLL